MQTWEYKTIKMETKGMLGGIVDTNQLEDTLNSFGRGGWELVSTLVTQQSYGQSREIVMVFKRLTSS